MKNIFKYLFATLVIIVFLAGCSKKLDQAGISPNDTSNVPASILLTATEVSLGYNFGGEVARFAGIFDQHVFGADRQFTVYNQYNFGPSDFDQAWLVTYTSLYNLKDLSDSSVARKQYAYAGIANILSAYTLGIATDFWGDIPYTTALKGQSNVANPATFDKQSQIYDSIQALLSLGIAQIGMENGSIVPGSDDLIYKGKLTSWTKMAYALKARYYLHLSKVNPAALANATAAIANGFTSSADDAYVNFGNSSKSANPWYQFFQQRAGYISLIKGFAGTKLINESDPRLPALVDTASDKLGYFYNKTSAGVQIITYAEQRFMEAEIALQKNDKHTAATAMNEAAVISVTALTGSAPDSTWNANHASETSATVTLEKIMNQKYLALFLNPESFTDWRRTNFPTLSPYAGSSIPRRFLYPESELERNKNTPKGVQLTDKVGWDL